MRPTMDPDQMLQRAAELTVELHPDSWQSVTTGTGGVAHGRSLLWALDAFESPTTPRAVARLAAERAQSPTAWVDAMESIRALYGAGALYPVGAGPRIGHERGFARESQHVQMLDDEARTSAFLRAIRTQVTSEDIVVDVGTGTGILAIAAARAGARHVYAIEQSVMAEVAEAGARALGVEDRLTVLRGSSTNVVLPEPATLVVSEIIGDDPFDEGVLPTLSDVAHRLAAPGARYIPEVLTPVIQPVRLTAEDLDKRFYTSAAAQRWQSLYGIDFSYLLQHPGRPEAACFERRLSRLPGEAVEHAVELPPIRFPDDRQTYAADVEWCGSDRANALALGFQLTLAPGVELSSLIGGEGRTHWGVMVWVPRPSSDIDLRRPGLVTVKWSGGKTSIALVHATHSAEH